jgi:hypothetical protein
VTRADLPQFQVRAVEQGATASNGNIRWILHGTLSSTQGVDFKFWSWLLLPGRDGITGNFAEPRGPNLETTFTTSDKEKPQLEGLSLACLGAYHQAYHVWMVEDGPAAWTEGVFAASDAVAEHFVGTDGQNYRKLSKASDIPDRASESVQESDSAGGQSWVVPAGWDHEHCAICNAHVDPEDHYFHYEPFNAFLCVTCYQEYVLIGSIGFALPG